MALTPSTMPELGEPAPDFALPGISGHTVRRDDFADAAGLLVVFWCNHCPYVKHLKPAFAERAREWQARGIAIVAINANDADDYPDDDPDRMREDAETFGYTFDYLHDESQQVARDYRAACTPDFFLYDGNRRLFYRGQYDGSRPGNDLPITGADLGHAIDALLAGNPPPAGQKPSIGCNIKWRAG